MARDVGTVFVGFHVPRNTVLYTGSDTGPWATVFRGLMSPKAAPQASVEHHLIPPVLTSAMQHYGPLINIVPLRR